jgi:hypothetical protein
MNGKYLIISIQSITFELSTLFLTYLGSTLFVIDNLKALKILITISFVRHIFKDTKYFSLIVLM